MDRQKSRLLHMPLPALLFFLAGSCTLVFAIVESFRDAYLYGSWSVEIFPEVLFRLILVNEGIYFGMSAGFFIGCFLLCSWTYSKKVDFETKEPEAETKIDENVSYSPKQEDIHSTNVDNPFEK